MPSNTKSSRARFRGWIDDAWRDAIHAGRTFKAHLGFTLTVVSTLALGIGVNTALFTIVNSVLLRPLPYVDPGRIVVVWERDARRGLDQELVTSGSIADWRARNSVFETIGYSPAWPGARVFLVANQQGHERVAGAYASSGMLKVLGIQPLMGRLFTEDDDVEGGPPVALVSHRYWQRTLSGRPDVLGQRLLVDKYSLTAYTIVGVLPPGFSYPEQSDLWLGAGQMGVGIPEPGSARRGGPWFEVIARLRPGVTVEGAEARLRGLQQGLVQTYPGTPINAEVTVRGLHDHLVGPARTPLLVLFGAVTFVLLIACANVANLLLARGAARQRELHIRAALGADRGRVLRQLLVESLGLSLLGGIAGILVGYVCLHVTIALGRAVIPHLADVRIDGLVLLFTSVTAVGTGLLFGTAPAVQFWTGDLNRTLTEAGRGSSSSVSYQRAQRALVVAEVALALVLLLGATLLVQSLVRLRRVEPGFRTDHGLVVSLDLSSTSLGQNGAADRREIMHRILTRVERMPGVRAAGASSLLPMAGGGWDDRPGAGWANQSFTIEHRAVDPQSPPTADPRVTTPDFFRAIGVPVRLGRVFTDGDDETAASALVVNETFARRYFPNYPHENPIGRRVVFVTGDHLQIDAKTKQPQWRRIIGVVGDMRSAGLHAEPRPEMYLAYAQVPWEEVALVIHTTGEPLGLAAAVRREIAAINQAVTVMRATRLEDVIDESVAAARFRTRLLAMLAAAALALAAVGIYGTMTYAVAQRTRAIGIRMALGAQRRTVLMHILREALVLTTLGVALGLAAALVLQRAVAALLFGIGAMDPLSLALAGALLAAVAALASLVPALRATRIDPLVALRAD